MKVNRFDRRRVAGAALAGALLAGCTPVPTALPVEEVPPAYVAPRPDGSRYMLPIDWWKNFESGELNELVDAARKDNLDLAVYAARVKQAQASTGVAAANLFPSVELDAAGSRTSTRYQTSDYTYNTFKPVFSGSYQVDLWGKLLNNLRYYDNTARATMFKRDASVLSVTAQVADAYFTVLALRERLAIARRNVQYAKDILEITRARVIKGAESGLGLSQQAAIVKSEEAVIPNLEDLERQALYKLAVLVGRPPEKIDIAATSLKDVVAPPVNPGLPSDLLRRRPDVAAAEESLKAAHANVDAARAAFLPSISLTASGGTTSTTLKHLLDPGALTWTIAASLAQTIFDGGALTSKRDYYQGVEEEMIATYRSTMYGALTDVETALSSIVALTEREKLIGEQAAHAAEAFRISELQYRQGVVTLLTVLDTQQTMFSAQDNLVQITQARFQAVVDLCYALGGGWDVKAETEKNEPTRNRFMPLPLPMY